MTNRPSRPGLSAEATDLRARLAETEEALRAIRTGAVDAVLVAGERGAQVYTLSGALRGYRQLVETMSEGAATLSADGVILYGNDRLAKMLQRPLDQVMGSALRDYLPPADQQALAEILVQARTAPSRREISLQSGAGRAVPVYLSASHLHGEDAEAVFCLVLTDLTEQKHHAELVAAERLARSILEQAAEAIVVCDAQGRVVRASQAALPFCDGSPLQRPFAEAFPLRAAAAGPFLLAPVLHGETVRDVDVALDRDGQELDLILNAGPLLSGQGILGCVVTLTDITERRSMEAGLRVKNQVFENSIASQSVADKNGVITHVNPAFLRLWGYADKEEATGKRFRSFFADPADATPVLEALAAHDAWEGEFLARRTDGSTFVSRGHATSLRDATGELTGFQSTTVDVTPLREAEQQLKGLNEELARSNQELRDSKQLVDAVVENIPLMLFLKEAQDLRFVVFNRAGEDLLGYDRKDLLGKNNLDIFPPEQAAHFMAKDREALANGVLLDIPEEPIQTAKKGERLLHTRKVCIKGPDGVTKYLLGISEDITERKQAEEAREHLKAELEESQRIARIGSWEWTLATDARSWSRGMAHILARDPGLPAPTTEALPQFFTPESWQRLSEAIGRAVETGAPYDLETEMVRADGTTCWTTTRGEAIRGADGTVVKLRGTVLDINERKLAEEETESQSKFPSENPNPVLRIARDGRLLYINEAGLRLLPQWHLEVGSASPLILREVVVQCMDNGSTQELDLEHGERAYSFFVAPIVAAGYANLYGREVTDRKQAEAAQRLQSAALNAAANAMVITDRDSTIVWANPAFSTLTGYPLAEAIGKSPRELLKSGAHDQAFYKHMWDTILAGDVWSGEVSNRRKDGSQYPEQLTITPVKDARGEVTHFIALLRDLTSERAQRAQLLQSQKMESVGQLAGGIAHDFNNLLTVMITTADLALGELKEGDPLHEDFQEVRRAADRAAGLTRQLLAFSRKQLLQPEVLDLNAVVAGMQTMLRRLIRESIELVFAPAKDLGSIKADPGQLEQVIMNLAVNARDAMPNGGTLTIETRNVELDEAYAAGHPSVQPGPYVMLAVSDTGVGMNEATRQRIFEPFFTTKEAGRGTGLGLSTVYGIVKQSGGSISVYSEPGKGTTFKIFLTRTEAAARASQPAAPATSARGTETVLVVEDDAALRHMAGRLLLLSGYTVLTASNGAEALALLERHEGPVPLMLTDMVMPGMSGWDLATQLKDIRPQMKVIFTSGYTDDALLHNGQFDAGAHFISKPYTATDLRRKVREVLDS